MNLASEIIIETRELTKKYNDFIAVNSLNLSIKKSEIFGLLGPNGAGKTTILLMLLGLTEPTSGKCSVCGFNPLKEPLKIKSLLGYLPERVGVFENITAKQNLKYIARLNRIPSKDIPNKISKVLDNVGLENVDELKVGKFSRGMKQRLGIANILIKEPKVVFLDEPTQGLDPKGITEILNLFKNLNVDNDVTILVSSHLIHQMETLCTKIGIMVNGKLVMQSEVSDLYLKVKKNWLIEIEALNINDYILNKIYDLKGVIKIDQFKTNLIISCESDLRSNISQILIKNGALLNKLIVKNNTLDEIYAKYSGVL